MSPLSATEHLHSIARDFGTSNLMLKLESIRQRVWGRLTNKLALQQAEAAALAAVVFFLASYPFCAGLLASDSAVQNLVGGTLMLTAVVLGAGFTMGRVNRYLWEMIRRDYQRAQTALHSTDLAAVIADDDLRAEAYRRLDLPKLPKWLTGNETIERHVQRGAQHFEALLKFADGGNLEQYWSEAKYAVLPERTALLALCDFYTGAQSDLLTGWRCTLAEKPALLRYMPEVPVVEEVDDPTALVLPALPLAEPRPIADRPSISH
jgi:hypothetical protein